MSDRDRFLEINDANAPRTSYQTPTYTATPRVGGKTSGKTMAYKPPADTRAATTTYASPYGTSGTGYTTVNPMSFNLSQQGLADSDQEDAWAAFAAGSGIEELGVPINWWPGLMTQAQVGLYSGIVAYGGIMTPEEFEKHGPEAWAAPNLYGDFYDPTDPTGERQARVWSRYDPGMAAQQFMLMGAAERARYTTMMVDAGLLDKEWRGIGDFDPVSAAAFGQALSLANYWGKDVRSTLTHQANMFKELNSRRGGGGGGGGGPQVKIEVPDYETLIVEAKAMLRQKLGRDPQDWEMTLIADHMKQRYGQWAEATKARMVGGNGTYEVPDPVALTTEYVEDTYTAEISRLGDISDARAANQILIQAATKGTQMMGGLGGQGR